MAKSPVPQSNSPISNVPLGPKMIGFGLAVVLLTAVIRWLPLSFLGTWINGVLWPVAILSIIGGGALTYLRSKRG